MTAPAAEILLTVFEVRVLLRMTRADYHGTSERAAEDLGSSVREVAGMLRLIRQKLGVDSTSAAGALLRG